jgi:hypothetical protein
MGASKSQLNLPAVPFVGAEDLAGVLVGDCDVVVGDEDQDGFASVIASDAEVVQLAGPTQCQFPELIDDVGASVESVFDTLKGRLTLEDHGGRTIPGVYSRVAGPLLALAAGIWHNWLIGTTSKRSLIAYDH